MRLATALRVYVHHELAELINRVVLLDRPAVAAGVRKQLVGNTDTLGELGANLHPLTASLMDLADKHTERWSDSVWRGSRALSQIAMRGSSSHPTLERRLRSLGGKPIDTPVGAPTVHRHG